jgi:hypothetical protein
VIITLYVGLQAFEADGFVEDSVHAGIVAGFQGVSINVCSDGSDRDVVVFDVAYLDDIKYLVGGLYPIESWHVDVGEHVADVLLAAGLFPIPFNDLNGFETVSGPNDVVLADLVEHEFHGLEVEELIVDDQPGLFAIVAILDLAASTLYVLVLLLYY